jgi:hypothetical protein
MPATFGTYKSPKKKPKPHVMLDRNGLPMTRPGQVTPTVNVAPRAGRPNLAQPGYNPAYKDWLNDKPGRKPTAEAALEWWNLYGQSQGAKKPVQVPAAAVAPRAATPTGTPAVTPTAAAPRATTTPPARTTTPGPSPVTLTGSTMPSLDKVPTADPNALYAPAERQIAAQRAAALAAQDKAFRDNLAYEQFIQSATQQGNTALGSAMSQLSAGAAASRQSSIDNIQQVLGAAQLAGGTSGDLQRLSGTTAAGQSNSLLQAGQSAQSAVPDLVGQAALRYAQGQGQVGAAQGRVMNDAAVRATQAALTDTAKMGTDLETAKADAALKEVGSQRDYMVQAAQLDALERFNSGKLTQDQYATQSKLYADLTKVQSQRDVENMKAQTAAQVEAGRISRADAANLNKLAIEQLRQTATTNRTLLTLANTGAAKGNKFAEQGVSLVNRLLSDQTQDFKNMNRHDKGQFAKTAAQQLVTSYGAAGARPNGLKYNDLYNILAGVPGMNVVLGDPTFVAWLKNKLPPGAR